MALCMVALRLQKRPLKPYKSCNVNACDEMTLTELCWSRVERPSLAQQSLPLVQSLPNI